jgi:hypothetical protein
MANTCRSQLVTELCANVSGHEGRETRATSKIKMVKEDLDCEEPNEMVTKQIFAYEELYLVETSKL